MIMTVKNTIEASDEVCFGPTLQRSKSHPTLFELGERHSSLMLTENVERVDKEALVSCGEAHNILSPSSVTQQPLCIPRQAVSLICLSTYFRCEEQQHQHQQQEVELVHNRPLTPLLEGIMKAQPSSDTIVMTTVHVSDVEMDDRDDQVHQQIPVPPVATITTATTRTTTSAEQQLLEILDAIARSQWKRVAVILERNPHLARHPVSMVLQGENSTCLLVHLLSGTRDTPVAIIDQLVTLYPASLLLQESRAGRLPLHIAVVKESHAELVRYLCRAHPQALQKPDQEGNLPLHYAAMYGSSPEVLQTLLQAYPDACGRANTRDRLPIHLVCARCYEGEPDACNRPSILPSDLEAMIQAYPAALKKLDRFGRTPLHLACNIRHPQWQLLQVLIEYEPECLLIKDKARSTPLQCARKGKHLGNDLVVASLAEATQKERKRQNKGMWFISRHASSRKTEPAKKELYCCYG